jgi:hypothetical protein
LFYARIVRGGYLASRPSFAVFELGGSFPRKNGKYCMRQAGEIWVRKTF